MKIRGACIAILLAAGALHAQTWVAVRLHPPGAGLSAIYATDGKQQAGHVDGRAAVWEGTASSYRDIHPLAGATASYIYDTSGGQQVGNARVNSADHAVKWSGTTGSFVDLHPAGANGSGVRAAAGNQQVGYVVTAGGYRAGLWTGTAASFTDLHPAGAQSSAINATTGTQQVGSASFGGEPHAALWSGTTGSFVDLRPAGASFSGISDTTGTQQAGYARFGENHAGIWAGTPGSFIDLHPVGAEKSDLSATTGIRQVGVAEFGGLPHAGIWAGTAGSFIDLHAFLPANYRESEARDVSGKGKDLIVVGQAFNSTTSRNEAFLWRLNRPPEVRISGKKIRVTAAPRLLVRGSAADPDGNLSRVKVKVDGGRFKNAKGIRRWKFIARHLTSGRNIIRIRATDIAGARSSTVRLVVMRQQPINAQP